MIPVTRDSVLTSEHRLLEQKLGKIAERIRDEGRKRRSLAEVLRRIRDDFQLPVDDENREIIESQLVCPVEKAPLKNLIVAGVDGGVLNKPLHGLDLILVRAVAAIFSYENGNLQNADYHPSEMPVPRLINVHEPLDSKELDVLVGLKRQLSELSRARETVRNRDIDVLLLDGSVVPGYTNLASGIRTRELYKNLVDSFTDLYQECTDEGVLLLGAVKDSRSARLSKIFQRKLFPKIMGNGILSQEDASILRRNEDILRTSTDTAFLDYLLDAGERSFVFSYANPSNNILEDFGDWKRRIYAFYLKPVPYDCPMRIEFVAKEGEVLKTIERSSSLVSSLSNKHDACALPSVLIEADARAALAKEEISILRDNIADRLDPSTMLDLRRERRPF